MVWTVNHNLGVNPAVALFSPGGLGVEGEVQHLTLNTCQITFNVAQAGSAIFT